MYARNWACKRRDFERICLRVHREIRLDFVSIRSRNECAVGDEEWGDAFKREIQEDNLFKDNLSLMKLDRSIIVIARCMEDLFRGSRNKLGELEIIKGNLVFNRVISLI